ncbi:hypothetical protein JTE90_016861 [Oedothorax gibbosus]|uniref:Uncharacterized protein n=1 Tax=Oedothorax gibbosus TaxID=931172 RepID=A0AAV6W122_9ARAC|nr:hypothetical protein JTE90_016861 [Oedothorax gibbosus]
MTSHETGVKKNRKSESESPEAISGETRSFPGFDKEVSGAPSLPRTNVEDAKNNKSSFLQDVASPFV